jgi:phosphoribosylamine--glycine ligase
MKVLVVGAGGREHALVWKLSQSPLIKKIFAAPGNAGMTRLAECLPIAADKTVELADFAVSNGIDLTVVGPEGPLVHGIVDYFKERRLTIFGPTKAAARLEGSKAFAKQMMEKYGLPTARFNLFTDLKEALAHLEKCSIPVVVKADGLAAGKGAIVAQTREEAIHALTSMLKEKLFGEAGSKVVIEEFLEGEEVSVLAVVDGTNLVLLEPSQDHKRALDGDQGPNTGGMGAYSPVPMVTPRMMGQIRGKVFEPMVRGMAEQGTPFHGILNAGLMLTADGPKVLEFNVRFGDPETQALLPRLKSDLAELLLAAAQGNLQGVRPVWDSRAAACVVLASQGYPGKYDMGREITGLKEIEDLPETLLFHAGTKHEGDHWLTVGGRVFSCVGLGDTLEQALERAYAAAEKIKFEGKHFRKDIGARALAARARSPSTGSG